MELENEVILAAEVDHAAELAKQQGWRPLEEWEGNPEEWVDAKTFNQRGEYMDRIKTQSSLIKKLEKKLATHETTLKELAEHHKRVADIEYKRALDDLKGLKKEALELGDHGKVVEIDDKIQDLKAQPVKPEPAQNAQEMHPDVMDWIEQNPWYEEDAVLAGAANGLVGDMIRRDPSLQGRVREVLEKVTTQLKEEFPNKFGKKVRMSTVTESSTSDTKQSAPKYTARHLNADQKQIAKRFIAAGAIKSMDEYAQQMAEINGLDAQRGA